MVLLDLNVDVLEIIKMDHMSVLALSCNLGAVFVDTNGLAEEC